MSNPLIEAAVLFLDKQLDEQTGTSPSHTVTTDSGTARVTPTHVHFHNSGYKNSFTHHEIDKMRSGGEVRGFSKREDHRGPRGETSFSDGEVDHHLPGEYKDHSKISRNLYKVRVNKGTASKGASTSSDTKSEG